MTRFFRKYEAGTTVEFNKLEICTWHASRYFGKSLSQQIQFTYGNNNMLTIAITITMLLNEPYSLHTIYIRIDVIYELKK